MAEWCENSTAGTNGSVAEWSNAPSLNLGGWVSSLAREFESRRYRQTTARKSAAGANTASAQSADISRIVISVTRSSRNLTQPRTGAASK